MTEVNYRTIAASTDQRQTVTFSKGLTKILVEGQVMNNKITGNTKGPCRVLPIFLNDMRKMNVDCIKSSNCLFVLGDYVKGGRF